jgi:hypothetical protein
LTSFLAQQEEEEEEEEESQSFVNSHIRIGLKHNGIN